MPIDLLLVTVAKALVELAGLFILGQGVLYLLAGRKREGNVFYQLFQVLTRPVYVLARLITPKLIVDRHIPLVAFILLFWLWLVLTIMKVQICAGYGDLCVPQRERDAALSPRVDSVAEIGERPGRPL
jgi:hypothetical protein